MGQVRHLVLAKMWPRSGLCGSAEVSAPRLPYCVFDRGAPLQNLALNIAEKGFPISVYNRSYEKTEAAEKRAVKSGAPLAIGCTYVSLCCPAPMRNPWHDIIKFYLLFCFVVTLFLPHFRGVVLVRGSP
jgi:hypothetical protein